MKNANENRKRPWRRSKDWSNNKRKKSIWSLQKLSGSETSRLDAMQRKEP
jgi:hypothetical protein